MHTELVDKLWWPIELVFNTPSHHRVHHGSDPEHLDKNYGDILIIWDRILGTFVAERQRPTYGLTKPVGTYNLLTLSTGSTPRSRATCPPRHLCATGWATCSARWDGSRTVPERSGEHVDVHVVAVLQDRLVTVT